MRREDTKNAKSGLSLDRNICPVVSDQVSAVGGALNKAFPLSPDHAFDDLLRQLECLKPLSLEQDSASSMPNRFEDASTKVLIVGPGGSTRRPDISS
jgi:hypothetical protein